MPPYLDERLFRRSSGLLYKICKARGMFPTSYIVQPEHIHVDEFLWKGGFADVGKGEHRGRPVAVKQLRIERRDEFGSTFKVSNCTQLDGLDSLTLHPATLSGGTDLETPFSSKRIAAVGSLRV